MIKKLLNRIYSGRLENQRRRQEKQRLETLGQTVRDMGFTATLKHSYLQKQNPIWHLGCALELANKYAIKLQYGIMPCVATLEKENWVNEINLAVPASAYGSFFQDESIEKKKNRNHLMAGATSVREAVCQCLVNARTAGVL